MIEGMAPSLRATTVTSRKCFRAVLIQSPRLPYLPSHPMLGRAHGLGPSGGYQSSSARKAGMNHLFQAITERHVSRQSFNHFDLIHATLLSPFPPLLRRVEAQEARQDHQGDPKGAGDPQGRQPRPHGGLLRILLSQEGALDRDGVLRGRFDSGAIPVPACLRRDLFFIPLPYSLHLLLSAVA